MDRRVKERLIGASILVVLIVLIVPELLSGPASTPLAPALPAHTPEPVRNITVDLATSKAPAPEPAAPAPAPAPAPAGASGAQPDAHQTPDAHPLPNVQSPPSTDPPSDAHEPAVSVAVRPVTVPLETASPHPTSMATGKSAGPHGGWAVQLGSFASRENADKLLRQLKAQGFAAYVSSGGSGRTLRYRVRVGPLADHGAAQEAGAKLKSSGHASSIVSPGA